MRQQFPKHFQSIPLEQDTRILRRQMHLWDGIEFIEEIWIWKKIRGRSLVFWKKNLPYEKNEDLLKRAKQEGFPVEDDLEKVFERGDFVFINFKVEMLK